MTFEDETGASRINHVAQPVGSELCFAAVSAAALGGSMPLEEIDQALQAAFVSEENGSTAPPFDTMKVPIGDRVLVIEAVQSPMEGADSPQGFVSMVEERLDHDPVAVLFNKNLLSDDPDEARMHWVLLSGQERSEGGVFEIEVMNPEEPDMVDITHTTWNAVVDHSWNTTGIYAYALKVEELAA